MQIKWDRMRNTNSYANHRNLRFVNTESLKMWMNNKKKKLHRKQKRWENRLTVKQPQYLFTSQSLSSFCIRLSRIYVYFADDVDSTNAHTHCGRQQNAKQEANNESIAFAFYRNFVLLHPCGFNCHNWNEINDCHCKLRMRTASID